MYSLIEVYVFVLTSMSIIGGAANLYQLIQFVKVSKTRFVSMRKPTLVITYCVITLFISFIISPFNWYFQIFELELGAFIFEFIHETLIAFLLIIVLGRCYLLYFDYKFSESSLDKLWRGIIDPNEHNFWLRQRAKWGTVKYVWYSIFFIFFIAFIGLIFVAFFVYYNGFDSIIFHYFTMFGIGIPYFIILIFFICKINSIQDIYSIAKELKYLSVAIMLRSVALFFDVFVYKNDHHLLFYSTEMITQILSVWVQTWWVIRQYKQTQNGTHYVSKRKEFPLTMLDMFEHKKSSEIFLRHCVQELSVENILFLIEIGQFKAFLNEYNVGNQSLVYNQMNVNSKDFFYAVIDGNNNEDNNQQWIHLKAPQMVSIAQEAIYKQFQEHILNKKWIPIPVPLKMAVKGCPALTDDDDTERTMYDMMSTKSNSPESADLSKPIEITVISSNFSINKEDKENKEEKEVKTVDIDWIYDYSQHLYCKYIVDSADLSINISGKIREELSDVYSIKNHNAAFNKIQLIHDKQLLIRPLSQNEEFLFIQTYLYHSFDSAFHSIWGLLKSDTFLRFQKTPQYDILCKKVNVEKLKMEREQREIEYSRSRGSHDHDGTIQPT